MKEGKSNTDLREKEGASIEEGAIALGRCQWLRKVRLAKEYETVEGGTIVVRRADGGVNTGGSCGQ